MACRVGRNEIVQSAINKDTNKRKQDLLNISLENSKNNQSISITATNAEIKEHLLNRVRSKDAIMPLQNNLRAMYKQMGA